MKCLLCGRSFTVFSSFTSHVSRSHPGISTENAYNCEAVCPETGDFESDMDEVTSHEPSTDPCVNSNDNGISHRQMSAANFIVGLKEKHLVWFI